jgi:hypothetical protein
LADDSYALSVAWEIFIAMTDSAVPSHAALLNEHQRRRLEVVLSHVEAALLEIERLSVSGPGVVRAGVLTTIEADYPAHFTRDLAPLAAGIRDELARAKQAWGLGARRMSATRAISARVKSEMIRLQDSEPRRLKGYGIVHPDLDRTLTPLLHRLGAMLDEIGVAATGQRYARLSGPALPVDEEAAE